MSTPSLASSSSSDEKGDFNGEEEEEEEMEEGDALLAKVLYDHTADSDAELTVTAGDIITVLEPNGKYNLFI